MATEADFVAAVGDLIGDRFYPDFAPIDVVKPYAVYSQVGGESVSFLEGGIGSKRNARIQINVWSTTRKASNELMNDIEEALAITPFFATPIGALRARVDDEGKLRGAEQDFSLWFT